MHMCKNWFNWNNKERYITVTLSDAHNNLVGKNQNKNTDLKFKLIMSKTQSQCESHCCTANGKAKRGTA